MWSFKKYIRNWVSKLWIFSGQFLHKSQIWWLSLYNRSKQLSSFQNIVFWDQSFKWCASYRTDFCSLERNWSLKLTLEMNQILFSLMVSKLNDSIPKKVFLTLNYWKQKLVIRFPNFPNVSLEDDFCFEFQNLHCSKR